MKVYQPDPDDSLSISDRQIFAIYEDWSGTLWIGTDHGGLNSFNRSTETFTRYLLNPDDVIRENEIKIINEDYAGNMLVGNGNKLCIFNQREKSFEDIYTQDSIISKDVEAVIRDRLTGKIFIAVNNKIMIYDPEKKMLLKDDRIDPKSELGTINYKSLYQAVDGTIWIGHSKGLAKFNSLLNTVRNYQLIPSIQYRIENDISVWQEGENGLIWGGSPWGSQNSLGLICFEPETEQFKVYKSYPENKSNLSTNTIWSIYKDYSGVLWVGTFGAGLNKWDRSKNKIKRFVHDSNGDRFNTIYTIVEDRQGIIWFGTDNGLYCYDRYSNEFKNYRSDKKSIYKDIKCIFIDESGIIWFATRTRGLGRFDKQKGSFRFYLNNPNDSMSISSNNTQFILPDSSEVLWIGTWGGGLNKFNKTTGKFVRFNKDSANTRSVSSEQIGCIYIDTRKNLWLGTNGGGLNLFNRTDKSFKSFNIEKDKTTSVPTIYEDHKRNLWIGTYQSGMYLFDRDKGMPLYNISVKDGLCDNAIESILEDDSGNLWIGTAYGLSKFDPRSHRIKNYYTSDLFEENRYRQKSASKTSTGEMLFGTWDGFIMFNPDSIKDDPVPPQIVISGVSLFNRPGEKLKIDGFISEMKELKLSYDENDLRFDYVGLQYADPLKNRYKYKLEGFDKDWVDAGTQRNATYTNLNVGEYTFKVIACNEDGVWNKKGASIKIIIPPPFWETWWAYGFYFIVFASIMYGIRKYEMNRVNWKNQFKLDEVKLKEREETDKMKSRFFANISHEFRTPLTLILGPIEKILSKSSENETKKEANVVKRNASRLLTLINQLLDLSRLEAGKLELKVTKSNIVSFIKGITMSFESVAERKDITLKLIAKQDHIELYFDKEKMTKIMTNLLSNAFKFTPEGGTITVSINKCHSELVSESESNKKMLKQVQHDNCVEIIVRDTGIGISEEELTKLFDRFYQVDSSQTREHEGTGIGLALTKELVEHHHGTISVESKLGSWTEFTLTLLVGRKHLKDEEIVEEQKTTDEVILHPDLVGMKNLRDSDFLDSSSQAPKDDNEMDEDKYIVLVVEDNRDVREFIIDSLGNEFHIEEASNGEMGVLKAGQIIPDLIISDIMMPKMDGNELTKQIKNNERTSHIPVILLTAKSEQESRLEGLETGADDYLTKPFDAKELQIRIKNLIDIRRKLHEKFAGGRILQRKSEKMLSSLDENFLRKVLEIAKNHLSEEEFSIEEFVKEAGMSKTNFHRKLKAITGKSPSLYLRSVRLARAKEMIEDKKGNISEIAYSVGFSSPVYFSKCFKEEFGFSPSDLVH